MDKIAPVKGDIVNFQLVNNSLVGGERIGSKITGILDYGTAKMIDNELNIKHAALFPYFSAKVGGVDDPNAYSYISLANPQGKIEIVGVPWIEDSTYSVIQSQRTTYVITNWREAWRGPMTTFLSNLGATYTTTTADN